MVVSSPAPPFTPNPVRLRPYQAEVGRAIVASVLARSGLSFSVTMARQAGKNELSAQLELFLLARHARLPLEAIKCAPTFEPQALLSLRRLWTRLRDAGLRDLAAIVEGRSVQLGRARQLFLSAEPGSNVVGHTAGLLLEIDEAQDVAKEKFDRDFRPMVASTNASIVYYGTPWDDSTLLEEAKQHHLELERRDGVRRHFEFDWQAVAEHVPAYGRFVEGERQRLGEDHPMFRTQYALRTVAGEGRLFSASQRAQLQGSHSRRSRPAEGETYVAGLDLGGQALGEGPFDGLRTGPAREHDATVLTIARVVPPESALLPEPRLEVVEHFAANQMPDDELFARLADLLGSVWHVRQVGVDATGLGETLARLLARALGQETVRPLKFTSESKSRFGFGLLAAVNGGRLKVYAADGSPEYRAFWREAELARAVYRRNRTMNFFVSPADGHDDYLVSLALTVEAAKDVDPRPRRAQGRSRDEA